MSSHPPVSACIRWTASIGQLQERGVKPLEDQYSPGNLNLPTCIIVRKRHTQREDVTIEGGEKQIPKTFVIERGKVGHMLSQLVLDLRHIMEPHTASKLKACHKNVLKDFVSVAGPLGVTHLLLVTRTLDFVNLKICCFPRGPTITFHVKGFTLAREVLSSLKTPAINPTQFLTPPMLALNNFSSDNKTSHLLSTVFQNMLPSINIHNINLASVRRCLLLHSDPESGWIELRHYVVRLVAHGTSRGVKKLSRTHVPNLGQLNDISEYLLGGYVSESDGEDVGDGVTLPQDLPGRGNIKAEQSSIRLTELGPRLSLKLVKIEAGFCGGKILHHAFICKSRKEVRMLKLVKEKERRLKFERKALQERNISRKKKKLDEHKARCIAGMKGGTNEEEDDDDMEWYRKEVGEEPDPDTFGIEGSQGKVKSQRKRSLSGPSSKAKKMKKDVSEVTKKKSTLQEKSSAKRRKLKSPGSRGHVKITKLKGRKLRTRK